jgi:hypothetical protein
VTVRQDIAGVAGNDLQFLFALTYNGKPLSLSGYAVTITVKPSQTAPDSAGVTYTTSDQISVVSSAAGRVKLTIPHSATATPGNTWYRCDVSSGPQGIATAICGVLNLMAA